MWMTQRNRTLMHIHPRRHRQILLPLQRRRRRTRMRPPPQHHRIINSLPNTGDFRHRNLRTQHLDDARGDRVQFVDFETGGDGGVEAGDEGVAELGEGLVGGGGDGCGFWGGGEGGAGHDVDDASGLAGEGVYEAAH